MYMNRKALVFILGNLTAFGPFVTDFYLPCLPELASRFSASASLVQVSLTAGMLGLAAGQLLLGPVTDKYGRKRPLRWCLLLFVLATGGCMASTSIVPFVGFRLLQGLTGAGGLVISKAVVADSFSPADLARYFSFLAAVQGAAPVVAPVIGGAAFSLSSWQGAFGVLGLWAAGLFRACRGMEETLAEKDRLRMPVWKTFGCYAAVVRNRPYMVMNLMQGFASAALMAYISASPFIFQRHFGLTPMAYSLCFAGNAAGLVAGSAAVMKARDLRTAAGLGSGGLLVAAALVSLALWAGWPFPVFEAFLFLMLFGVGVVTPVAVTLSLRSVTAHRGMASALLGAVPFLLGGIVAPLTGLGDMLRSMSLLVTLCAAASAGLCLLARRLDNAAGEAKSDRA